MHFQKYLFGVWAVVIVLLLAVVGMVSYGPANTAYAVDDSIDGVNAINGNELLVFEVDRKVTVNDRGFPRDDPPKASANGNWVTPINYAQGTFYYRAFIRNQPRAQNMKLQFCAWQDQFKLESCGKLNKVSGESGTLVTWSQPVNDIWKKGGVGVDWRRARQRYGLAIKNSQGEPVSNYQGWNWNGENPNHWYPLDICFTVVVVAKGSNFSGWNNYRCNGGGGGGGNPTATPTNTPRSPGQSTPTPTPTPTATPISSPPTGGDCDLVEGNLVQNGDFEGGFRPWRFYSKKVGSSSITSAAYACKKAAELKIDKTAKNIQLYQARISVEANTKYRLTFAAYSSSGNDIGVYLQNHKAPYTNYGLSVHQVNLTQGWQRFTVDFTTKGFSGTANNARLRFWISSFADAGDTYGIDAISLVKLNSAEVIGSSVEDDSQVTQLESGLLIGIDEAAFDARILNDIEEGNFVEEEAEIQLFLPMIAN